MIIEEEDQKKKIKSVQLALSVFSEISGWIAVPVIVAVIIGKNMDRKYGTAPYIMLGAAMAAFLISSLGIILTVKRYSAGLKKNLD